MFITLMACSCVMTVLSIYLCYRVLEDEALLRTEQKPSPTAAHGSASDNRLLTLREQHD
jgi:hypothetical protein